MISFEWINYDNVDAMVALLWERNQTRPEYTRWKYGRSGKCFGLLARRDATTLGCFGLVPRELRLASGETTDCAWFADWYVIPGERGNGIGAQLLREVSACYPVIFGHPGPPAAQALCLANGYRPVRFHSRRRVILRPLGYLLHRPRMLGGIALALSKKVLSRATPSRRFSIPSQEPEKDRLRASLADLAAHKEWLQSEPVAHAAHRHRLGVWCGTDVEIHYADDEFRNGERRWRVLYAFGNRRLQRDEWSKYFKEARRNGCVYAEIFSTEREMDSIWASLGGRPVAEPPVLVHGKYDDLEDASLHGWDRENWTYV